MAAARKTVRPRTENRRRRGQDSTGNRRLTPPRKTMTGLWIVLMVLFFAEALFYAWCRVQCVTAGYDIDRENSRYQALLKERNTLRIELARLKSPERIETIARTRLGLVMPDVQQTVILR
jgi:cell division protein FtsL